MRSSKWVLRRFECLLRDILGDFLAEVERELVRKGDEG